MEKYPHCGEGKKGRRAEEWHRPYYIVLLRARTRMQQQTPPYVQLWCANKKKIYKVKKKCSNVSPRATDPSDFETKLTKEKVNSPYQFH